MASEIGHEHVLKWDSVKFDDGSRYEGVVKENQRHVRGVTHFPSGDRYEGEYQADKMSGLGAYVWKQGAIYRGEWKDNMMHGCGVLLSPQPGGKIHADEGEWLEDRFVGDIMACSVSEARSFAAMADNAAVSAQRYELGPAKGQAGKGRAASISLAAAAALPRGLAGLAGGVGRGAWGAASGRWWRGRGKGP